MAVESCRDGLLSALHFSSKTKALLIYFFFPTELTFHRFMKKTKTRERFEFLTITWGYCRSTWEVAQAAPGGQCGIRNRDVLGGRSQCCLWHCCFPRREEEGMGQEGRNLGEHLGGAALPQHDTEQQRWCEMSDSEVRALMGSRQRETRLKYSIFFLFIIFTWIARRLVSISDLF